METKDNLELWHKVEKTNPKYTKNANVRGNKITSIAPQFQIMNVTEQFGSYGIGWGIEDSKFDYTLAVSHGLVTFEAIFFYPNGKFKIQNSISLWTDNAKTKIDSDFAKKVETDTLTKAMSKLGFNADIFLGKFDDLRYIDEMNEEFGNDKTTAAPANTGASTTNTNQTAELPWLNEKDPVYPQIVEAVKNGTRTISMLREKFKISKAMEATLTAFIPKS